MSGLCELKIGKLTLKLGQVWYFRRGVRGDFEIKAFVEDQVVVRIIHGRWAVRSHLLFELNQDILKLSE